MEKKFIIEEIFDRTIDNNLFQGEDLTESQISYNKELSKHKEIINNLLTGIDYDIPLKNKTSYKNFSEHGLWEIRAEEDKQSVLDDLKSMETEITSFIEEKTHKKHQKEQKKQEKGTSAKHFSIASSISDWFSKFTGVVTFIIGTFLDTPLVDKLNDYKEIVVWILIGITITITILSFVLKLIANNRGEDIVNNNRTTVSRFIFSMFSILILVIFFETYNSTDMWGSNGFKIFLLSSFLFLTILSVWYKGKNNKNQSQETNREQKNNENKPLKIIFSILIVVFICFMGYGCVFGNVDEKVFSYDNGEITIKNDFLFGFHKNTIYINNDVTKIRKYAFQGKSNIKILIIDGNVTKIDDEAFSDCKNLNKVTINAGDDEKLEIGFKAFANCPKLKTITIYRSDIDVQSDSFSINTFVKENNTTETTIIEVLRCTAGTITELYENYKFINENKTPKITLQKDNGEVDDRKIYYYGEKINESDLIVPEKEGYTFDGWYNGNEKYDFNKPVLSDFTLTAHYIINHYTITFMLDNGEENIVISQNYNTEITAPNNPTKTGYTFAGWSDTIPTTMPAEDMTVTAIWIVNQYTITFVLDNGEENIIITQDYETEINPPSNPTKTGYTFAGWNKAIPITMPAENMIVTAMWNVNKYKITFVLNNGEQNIVIEQDYNTNVTAPTPTRTGYTFSGWSLSNIPTTMPAENLTVTAIWIVNQYTITFVLDNGEENIIITQDYNTEINPPSNPTKTGYTFAGWNKAIPITMPAENMIVTARWNVNKYKITFVLNNGEQNIVIEQDYNTNVTAPTPTRTGYTFSGWSSSSVPTTMPAENMIVTAIWIVNQYTLTFVLDNGEENIIITQDYETEINIPSNQTKTGYTFAGWSIEVPATMPAENMIITALWIPIIYKITLDNGEDINESNFEFYLHYLIGFYNSSYLDNEITSINYPITNNYIFCGYYESVENNFTDNTTGTNQVIDENGNILLAKDAITENKTYYAMWKFETYGVSYTLSSDGKYYTASSYTYNGYDDIKILDSINNIPVTMIGDEVFKDNKNIKSVIITNNIVRIGNYAFSGCSNLISVSVCDDSDLLEIGYYAFSDCINLTDVLFENSQLTYINGAVFENCTNLTNISIPDTITFIYDSVFSGCNNLNYNTYNNAKYLGNSQNKYLILLKANNTGIESCIINSNTKVICGGAFKGCSSLSSVTVPNSISFVSSDAFTGCTNLNYYEFNNVKYLGNSDNKYVILVKVKNTSITSYTMHSSTRVICGSAFVDCANLNNITMSNNLVSIGDSAFKRCKALASVNIPNSVLAIGKMAFFACENIQNLTINSDSQLKVIGQQAFQRVSKLKTVKIPSGIKIIEFNAFAECDGLINIYFDNVKNWKVGSVPISTSSLSNSSTASTYLKTTYTSSTWIQSKPKPQSPSKGLEFVLSNDETYYIVSGIGDCIYDDIIIPQKHLGKPIKEIDDGAFQNKTINSIIIPDSVTKIGNYAFSGCSFLVSVTIPNNVTSIGIGAFSNCSSLDSIVIPSSLIIISSSTFYYCTSLTNITIPISVTSIGDNAFSHCESLSSIIFEENSKIRIIGEGAFWCTNISNITIPKSVTSIGGKSFAQCTLLEVVSFEEDSELTTIGYQAFTYCNKLTSFTIPSKVSFIGRKAFSTNSASYGLKNATFNNPNGWSAGSAQLSSSNLSNSSTAATYLISTYSDIDWTRT